MTSYANIIKESADTNTSDTKEYTITPLPLYINNSENITKKWLKQDDNKQNADRLFNGLLGNSKKLIFNIDNKEIKLITEDMRHSFYKLLSK